MKKAVISIGITSVIILALIVIASQSSDSDIKQEKPEIVIEADVIMPTKVSRPGCEEDNSCYVPSIIYVKQGEPVIWSNEDVAFHSVTSGFYEEPNSLFDSGYLDPQQQFTFVFDEKGTFDYFCTLHPWMAGKVVVE